MNVGSLTTLLQESYFFSDVVFSSVWQMGLEVNLESAEKRLLAANIVVS